MTTPATYASGLPSAGRIVAPSRKVMAGSAQDGTNADGQELGGLEGQVRARQLAGQVGAPVAPLDDLVEVEQGARAGQLLQQALLLLALLLALLGRAACRGVALQAVLDLVTAGAEQAPEDEQDGAGADEGGDQDDGAHESSTGSRTGRAAG